jgi:hypothetical protein
LAGWKCFLLKESSLCRRELRRYSSGPCPSGRWIHDAVVVIDAEIQGLEEQALLKGEFDGDPRWPQACACGRPFTDDDHWQVVVERLFVGSPDGKLYAIRDRELPAGAMWEAPWLVNAGWAGPDGRSYVVKLPTGSTFQIDGPESGGKAGWSRTGTAPNFTVSPSIHEVGAYHGHLVNGIISPCLEGHRFAEHPETA